MAWTSPGTHVVGQLLTASWENAQIRDNFLWIGGPDGRSTTFPGSPVDGQLFFYVADATNGVVWKLKYNTAEATYKWENVGGSALYGNGSLSVTTTGWSDLSNAVTVPRAGDYEIVAGGGGSGGAGGAAGMRLVVNGAVVDTSNGGSGNQTAYFVAYRAQGIPASAVVKLQGQGVAGQTYTYQGGLFVRPVRVV